MTVVGSGSGVFTLGVVGWLETDERGDSCCHSKSSSAVVGTLVEYSGVTYPDSPCCRVMTSVPLLRECS